MLSILDAQWFTLTPTLTYERRNVFWCPGASFTHLDPDANSFAVKVHQQAGHRSGNKIEEDEYTVQFFGSVPGAMAYQFVWENRNPRPTPNEKTGPYMVTVGPHVFDCDCTAGDCKVAVCKHRSAVCRAIWLGLVEGASPWDGMPESHEDVRLTVPGEVFGAEADEGFEEGESGLWFHDEPNTPTVAELSDAERRRLAIELGWEREPLGV